MEDLIQKQQYELVFHLLPNFQEKELEEKKRELEDLILKNGGLINRSGEIKKIRLAYPIKRERFSNFGFIEFFAPKKAIDKINKSLLLNQSILRHLILKKEEKKLKESERIKQKGEAEETKKVEEKEIDRRIEEILEKL